MGILDVFRSGRRTDYLAGPVDVSNIASPFSSAQLQTVVWQDVFGDLDTIPITRDQAMTVPAVAKGRALLVSTIAGRPLRALNSAGLVPNQPKWLSRTDGRVSPWHRMAWTLDDLMFFGESVWLVKRGADGFVLEADRCPPNRWKITGDKILIDEQEADEDEVLHIPGPFEGLLSAAGRTLRSGRDTEQTLAARSRNPAPIMELKQISDDDLEDDEIDALMDDWGKARRDRDGALAFTPRHVELRVHGNVDADVAIEARNAIRTDVGGYLGIPAALMDASLANSSLTYMTTEGNRSQFVDYTMPYWLDPIQHRLSMDDVVPNGQRVRFDLSDLISPTPAATGTPTED